MAWTNIEYIGQTSNSPLARYHGIGTRDLHKPDLPLLKSVAAETRADPGVKPSTKAIYLGWLAHERAVISERYGQVLGASAELDEAHSYWEEAAIQVAGVTPHLRLKIYHALALSRVRQQIIGAKGAEASARQVIRPQETRQYLAQLADITYSYGLDARGTRAGGEFAGLATEIVFAALMLDYSEHSSDKLIPYVTSPRVDSPIVDAGRDQFLSTAYDTDLQSYDTLWRPRSTYRIQLKTRHSDGYASRYDENALTIIEANAHLHIASLEDGRQFAGILAKTDRTPYEQNRVSNAIANVLDALPATV